MQGRGDDLVYRDGSNYFEKVCLRGQINKCLDKAWAFERTPGKILRGFEQRMINQVSKFGTIDTASTGEGVFILPAEGSNPAGPIPTGY